MTRIWLFLCVECMAAASLFSQTEIPQDTLWQQQLQPVQIEAPFPRGTVVPLEDIQGTYIFSGKKSEVISLKSADVDITNKTARQVFARIPGLFVYDMDGAGNQINISTRGLDPHRGWEFNIRKDGIITNSDMYGYPASHYSMPLESVDRIELVRGSGSLQYGAQFGGMLNYVSKAGSHETPLSYEGIHTVGSWGLVSTFNSLGGKKGKIQYYIYDARRKRNGYRDEERSEYEAQGATLIYTPDKHHSIRLEWVRSRYLYKLPGPLSDSMFMQNPRQATRSRNYYSPDIHVPSVVWKWEINPSTSLQVTTSAVLGSRSSVLFDRPVTIQDAPDPATGVFANRQVDIDQYNSYTSEWRILHKYKWGRTTHHIAAGAQVMHNTLYRRQRGVGTAGTDFDLSLSEPGWGRDLSFVTRNLAAFAENHWSVWKGLSAFAGVRIESGETSMRGTVRNVPDNLLPERLAHRYPLFGGGVKYAWKRQEIYSNVSQAYRPLLFKDLVPVSTFERVDPEISDARGYNAELGFRGSWKFMKWDLSGFLLQYDDRFGTLAQEDGDGNFTVLRTNTGDTRTAGVEWYVQANWDINPQWVLSFFNASAIMRARYVRGELLKGLENIPLKGNTIEGVPEAISRSGIQLNGGRFSVSILYSYTASSFADPFNTALPNSTASVGQVPAYGIWDVNARVKLARFLELRVNINNVLDRAYFTRRPLLYPGPGVWPSDGRNISVTLIAQMRQ
jgi:Fe(3+) dicitrate transport protein